MKGVIIVLLLSLVASSASAAPFLQAGYDAARTGATPDPGPTSDDVAFTVDLGAGSVFGAPPLVLDGRVYVLTERSLKVVDVATAAVTTLVDLSATQRATLIGSSSGVSGLASDGSHLFVGRQGGLDAYGLDGTGPLWSWEHPRALEPGPTVTVCTAPAVRGVDVYVVCHESTISLNTGYDSFGGAVHAASLRATTGVVSWEWTYLVREDVAGPEETRVAFLGSSLPNAYVYPPVLIGETVVVTIEQAVDPGGTLEDRFFALDANTGTLLWRRQFSDATSTASSALEPTVQGALATVGDAILPTGSDAAAFLRLRALVAVEPRSGAQQWSTAAGTGDLGSTGAGDLAIGGGTLFLATGRQLTRLDAASGAARWTSEIPGGASWAGGQLLITNGVLFGRVGTSAIHAYSTVDGSLLWTHDAATRRSSELAVGEGVLAYLSGDGGLTVLGSTRASLVSRPEISLLYPGVGEPVHVDLSSSTPGVFGPATEFRVDWGDGTVDDWQASPFFNHTYGAVGERTARFFARNDAGQTASITRTIHVGGTPPRELNFAQKAFDRENQDLTFGVLGVALALGGGVFAVSRQRTRRRRVQRELDAIEHAYAATRQRPLDCEAALAERRAHVRGLGLDGKLEQAEVLLLERRIDELAQQVRLEAVDDQFGFLTMSMGRTLREMLADGRISSWEREHFVRALDEDSHLTKAQKKRVREQIDAWHRGDAGQSSDGPDARPTTEGAP